MVNLLSRRRGGSAVHAERERRETPWYLGGLHREPGTAAVYDVWIGRHKKSWWQ